MLQFNRPAALEGEEVAVSGKSCRIPETCGLLRTQLVLESGAPGASPRTCRKLWLGRLEIQGWLKGGRDRSIGGGPDETAAVRQRRPSRLAQLRSKSVDEDDNEDDV